MMKRKQLCGLLCLLALVVWGCDKTEVLPKKPTPEVPTPAPPTVERISLESQEQTLQVGDTWTARTSISPQGIEGVELVWTSHDTAIATVSDQGVVTALQAGETIIEVQVKGQKDINAKCRLLVEQKPDEPAPNPGTPDPNPENPTPNPGTTDPNPANPDPQKPGGGDKPTNEPKKPIAVQGVRLNETAIELRQGVTYHLLRATILPENADNKALDWTSDKPDVASVSNQGHITTHQVGEAVISAISRDGGHRATCQVRVIPAKHEPTPNDVRVTGVSVELEPSEIQVGRELQMRAIVLPQDATNQNVTWSLSNPSVATISPTGLIKATRTGSTRIIVRTEDGGHVWTSREVQITRFEFRAGDTYRNLVGVDTQGKPTSLKHFVDQGHYVLLDFWGSWCGPCRWAMPHIKRIWDKFKDNGLIVIGVSCGDSFTAHQEGVRSLEVTWPQIIDIKDSYALSRTYEVTGFPTVGILDPEGKVVSWRITPREAENFLQSMLDERGRL